MKKLIVCLVIAALSLGCSSLTEFCASAQSVFDDAYEVYQGLEVRLEEVREKVVLACNALDKSGCESALELFRRVSKLHNEGHTVFEHARLALEVCQASHSGPSGHPPTSPETVEAGYDHREEVRRLRKEVSDLRKKVKSL